MNRRTALRQQGRRAVRDRERRQEVVEQVRSECADACVAAGLVPTIGGNHTCWNIKDAHEVISRGRRPGSHLEPELVVLVCRGHHDFITAYQDSDPRVREHGLGGFHAGDYDEAVRAVGRLKFRAAFGRWP